MLHLEFHVLRSPIALCKGLQGATRGSNSGLVHASGRALHAGIPRGSQAIFTD